MIGSFEENVIEYCGPTLAGLKAGSCFTCFRRQFPDAQQLIRDVDRIACEKESDCAFWLTNRIICWCTVTGRR